MFSHYEQSISWLLQNLTQFFPDAAWSEEEEALIAEFQAILATTPRNALVGTLLKYYKEHAWAAFNEVSSCLMMHYRKEVLVHVKMVNHPLFRWRQQNDCSSQQRLLRCTLWNLSEARTSRNWLRRREASWARPVDRRWTWSNRDRRGSRIWAWSNRDPPRSKIWTCHPRRPGFSSSIISIALPF